MMRLLPLFLILLASTPLSAAEGGRKPNIIFILVDDMGCDWLGCYGSSHPTPNVDKLAAQGVRFENAWASPLCTPTRVMMLTGQYPFRSGWTMHYDVPRWGGRGFDPDKFTTIARVLRDAGYATAIGGKWQINDLRDDKDIMKKHGFDSHCLWTGVENGNKPSNFRYWNAFLQINGERKTHEGKFGPDVIHAFVTDFITQNKDRPFFVYYPMIQVHAPNEPNPLNKDNPPTGENALYAGNVTHMDYQVGQLMKTLEDLKLTKDTIVVLSGDNGSSSPGEMKGKKIPASKARVTDLGVHVPLIVSAPMFAASGKVTDALVDFSDIFPTFAEFAGAPLPAGQKLDGRSIVPQLKDGAASEGAREWIYSQLGTNRTVRDKRYRLESNGEFYDLSKDPFEKNDISKSSTGEAAAARDRLANVLKNLPADAGEPFPGFANRPKK